jgi:PAS domain S-box-containing protein
VTTKVTNQLSPEALLGELAALRAQCARLEQLVASGPAMIYACRPEGTFPCTFVSPNVREHLGYVPDDFLSDSGFWWSKIHPDDRECVATGNAQLFVSGHGVREYRVRHADGSWRWVRDEMNLVKDDLGRPQEVIGVCLDISGRKHAEEQLAALALDLDRRVGERTRELRDANAQLERRLGEKVELMRELHHRVKNNMQIVASLLKMQAERAPPGEARDALLTSHGRVHAIAQAHEILYAQEDVAQIDIAQYVCSLTTQLAVAAGLAPACLEMSVDAGLVLPVDTAVPISLILNELVTNVLKHAYPDGRSPWASVSVRRDGSDVILEVRDRGAALPPGLDPARSNTLGLRLVGRLARQLDGEAKYVVDGGLRAIVRARIARRERDEP